MATLGLGRLWQLELEGRFIDCVLSTYAAVLQIGCCLTLRASHSMCQAHSKDFREPLVSAEPG